MFARRIGWIVGVVLSVCLLQVIVAADEDVKPDERAQVEEKEPQFMNEMVVTAGRVEEPRRHVTMNVDMIDAVDIERSPATDLGELLSEQGTGQIRQYPGAMTSFGIRGFRTATHGNDLASHVLLLVNGRRAGTGNAAKILTENVQEVEVIRGPASVQYGSAAMGGVVNVITKEGEGTPGGFIKGGYGSYDRDETTIGTSGAYEGFDFSAAFSRQTVNDYETAEGHDYKNTGVDREEYTSVNLGYEIMPNNRIGVIYTRYDADRVGTPGYFSSINPEDYKDGRNEVGDFIYSGETSSGLFSWKARYYTGSDVDKNFSPTRVTKRNTGIQGAQVQISYQPKHTLVTAGFDWVRYDIRNNDPARNEYDNPAWFLLLKRRFFNDRLILSGGLRHDRYDVDTKEGTFDGSQSEENTIFNAGATYILSDCWRVRAHVGEAFKMPSVSQLTQYYPPSSFFGTTFPGYKGNPALEPEKSITYEIGTDYSPGNLESSLTYFYTDFDDKIEQDPISGTNWVTYKNIGSANIQGIEAKANYNIAPALGLDCFLKPYVSVVYLPEYEDEESNTDLLYTSDITASYGITMDQFHGFGTQLDFTYFGNQHIEDWETGGGTVTEKGGFTVGNLSIWKKLFQTENNDGLRLQLEVRNLLDKDYSYVKGYPMPGRTFFLSASYSF